MKNRAELISLINDLKDCIFGVGTELRTPNEFWEKCNHYYIKDRLSSLAGADFYDAEPINDYQRQYRLIEIDTVCKELGDVFGYVVCDKSTEHHNDILKITNLYSQLEYNLFDCRRVAFQIGKDENQPEQNTPQQQQPATDGEQEQQQPATDKEPEPTQDNATVTDWLLGLVDNDEKWANRVIDEIKAIISIPEKPKIAIIDILERIPKFTEEYDKRRDVDLARLLTQCTKIEFTKQNIWIYRKRYENRMDKERKQRLKDKGIID